MQITTTAKIQVRVSPEQRELLDVTMDTYRSACNFVANYIFQAHDLKQRTSMRGLNLISSNLSMILCGIETILSHKTCSL